MFCPIGYRSAAELWNGFLAARFETVYSNAVKRYSSPDFMVVFSRGSPLDICEYLFLKSLADVGVCLASPDGRVMRVHVDMQDGAANLFTTVRLHVSAHYSAIAIGDPELEGDVAFIGEANFQAWDGTTAENAKMAERYRPSAEVNVEDKQDLNWGGRHHALLHHVQRRSYTVAATVPTWALVTAKSPHVAPLLEHYAGWAICIDEDSFENKWPDYLAAKIPFHPSDIDNNSVSQRGRPRLAAAYRAFAAMNFDRGTMTQKQVAEKIERETGEKPSYKSLRNWRNEALGKSN